MYKCVKTLAYSSAGITVHPALWSQGQTATVGVALNVLGVWQKNGFSGRKLEFASSSRVGVWWILRPLRHMKALKPLKQRRLSGVRLGLFCMQRSSAGTQTYSISSFQRDTWTGECIYMRFGRQGFRRGGLRTTLAAGGLDIRRKSSVVTTRRGLVDMSQNTSVNLLVRMFPDEPEG